MTTTPSELRELATHVVAGCPHAAAAECDCHYQRGAAALRAYADAMEQGMIPPKPDNAERLIWLMKPVDAPPFRVEDDTAKGGA